MKSGRARVLLVDDHAVVRAGYRMLLQQTREIDVVGEAESGEQACRLFVELAPDVVVMDLALPGIGGLEALRRIVQRDPAAKVLVFSMHEESAFVEQALAADIAERLAFARVRGRDSPFAQLSTREFEIFCLLAEGLGAGEIAKRLSLSQKTVANYGTQLKTKLDVSSTAELTRLAIRHGIIAA